MAFDHKKYRIERKEKLEAAGLCINCGKRPPEEGKKQCTNCLENNRKQQKSSTLKKAAPPAAPLAGDRWEIKEPKQFIPIFQADIKTGKVLLNRLDDVLPAMNSF
jgi:hypothetical protein